MIIQCSLLAAAGALGLAPPANGLMLVAPVLSGPPPAALDWILPTGAMIVAPGPYAGSFVVFGSRSSLFAAAIPHGSLLLTARYTGCIGDTKAPS